MTELDPGPGGDPDSGAGWGEVGTTGARVEAVIFDWGGTLTPWHEVDLTAGWYAYCQHLRRPACREPCSAPLRRGDAALA